MGQGVGEALDDEAFLRRSFDVARAAHAAGHHPFGAVLVGPDAMVLMEQGNGFAEGRDMTAHAERVLMGRLQQVRHARAKKCVGRCRAKSMDASRL